MFARTAAGRGLAQIRHVSPVRRSAAPDLVASVHAQVERDFGMLAPPVGLHSPAPGPLAASWLILRETLIAAGLVGRAAKEALAAAVSIGNTCPYCVDVHTAVLHGLVRGRDGLAIAENRVDSLADPDVREAVAWARASGTREAAARHRGPWQAGQVPELIGVAVTFQYFNRMVHVFLPDSPIPAQVPAAARGVLWRLLGRFMWPSARSRHQPGASLDLLPAAQLPADLCWAAGADHIAGAFARATAAIEAAGARSVPGPVRDLVTARLAGWNGQQAGLSRAWVNDAAAGLVSAERPAGRLALLTALASHQVDQSVIDEYRATRPGDDALVELTSWASFAAARRVSSWLAEAAIVGPDPADGPTQAARPAANWPGERPGPAGPR